MSYFRYTQRAFAHAVGIDISDGSLEYVDITEARNGTPIIHDHARVTLPDHVIVHGLIRNERVLSSALKQLTATIKTDERVISVVSALPDEQVLVKTVPLTATNSEVTTYNLPSLAHTLFEELGYHIPKPVLQWKYASHALHGKELTLFATSRHYVEQWLSFFRQHSMKLEAIEMESLAVARSLIKRCVPHESIGVIDLGYRQTNFSIFSNAGLHYSHSIEGGGLAITQALAQHLNTTDDHAEEIKLGLDMNKKSDVMDEAQTLVAHYVARYFESIRESIRQHNFPITKILLTGGGARMKGIRSVAERTFKTPVHLGTTWISPLQQKNIHLKDFLSSDEHQIYAGAIGLALRGLNRYTLRSGINFIQR